MTKFNPQKSTLILTLQYYRHDPVVSQWTSTKFISRFLLIYSVVGSIINK